MVRTKAVKKQRNVQRKCFISNTRQVANMWWNKKARHAKGTPGLMVFMHFLHFFTLLQSLQALSKPLVIGSSSFVRQRDSFSFCRSAPMFSPIKFEMSTTAPY